jgi:hypothetical protein
MFQREKNFFSTANLIVKEGIEADVVRYEFSEKEFKKCLGTNISRIVFINSV